MALSLRSDVGRKALEWGGISLVAIVVGLVIGGAPGGSPPDSGVQVSASATSSSSTTSSTLRELSTTAVPSSTTSSVVAVPLPTARPASEVKVKLYNGSSVGGAAVVAGKELKAAGFVVLPPGPSTGPRAESSIWHRPGFEAEAASVAETLSAPGSVVARLPEPPPMPGAGNADVVVVVGDDVAKR